MNTVNCPFCSKEIENDSFYCDQCGQELRVCPSHGFKKGKICSECGTKLVEAKNVADNQTQPTVVGEPRYLISNALNAKLELKNGAVIGRTSGDYINVFANQVYVSRTHARLQKNSAGAWEIVDLESANGTFLNEQKLAPNLPVTFKIGDTITFYNMNFLVSE